jgi:hypothetical protein
MLTSGYDIPLLSGGAIVATSRTAAVQPNAAHVLLAAVRRAIEADVDGAKISAILAMAENATGSQQAPGFTMCANTLDALAKDGPARPPFTVEK